MVWFLPVLGALTVAGSVWGLQDLASSDVESAGLSAEQLLEYENLQLAQAQAATAAAVAEPKWYKSPTVILLGGAALAGLALYAGSKL